MASASCFIFVLRERTGMPAMKPTELTFDIDAIDSSMSLFSKLPRAIGVNLSEKVTRFGVARVDGIPLSYCEQTQNGLGKWVLLVPVGEVAREYDRVYTVTLEGFYGKYGRKFPACTFALKTDKQRQRDLAYDEHDAQALNAAREGMVLLKNENQALPLKKGSVLNCFGEGQHLFRITATGASRINPRWAPTFCQAVAQHSEFIINEELADHYRLGNPAPDGAMLRRAREKSDTALIFLTRHSGEAQDNRPIPGQYYLTDEELAMMRAVTAVFNKTVLILNTGYPVAMNWLKDMQISSILYTGFAGMLASYALVEILDGRTNPSGCLADTWAWDYWDDPVSKNQPVLDAGTPVPKDNAHGVRIYYEEDVYLGYRYFDTFEKSAAWFFGDGISYTDFELRSENLIRNKKGIALDVTVTNTGAVPGKKAVQLYASAPSGKLEKPRHVLVAFDKTRLLAPGESQTLSLTADNLAMASFDEETASWQMEKGIYKISAGKLSDLQEVGRFALPENRVLLETGHWGCPAEPVRGNSAVVPLRKRIGVRSRKSSYRPKRLPGYRGPRISWDMLKKDKTLLDAFVAQMTLGELAQLNVCAGGLWGEGENGCAGHTYALEKYGLPSFCVSDANAGLNIRRHNIGFPSSNVIAATFNKEIAYTVGRVIAEESLENGIFLNLGPGMNLHRNKLCGRHPEYFSEDPFLTGIMAGYHGKGLEENGLACCYKHLFCNGSELSRMGSHSIVTERALRELYFRCFQMAFSIQKPSSVMTGYNALNGLYPAENPELLQNLLRGEWGFEGFVMSDWNSYFTVNAVEMVKAGNCWLTLGGMLWVWIIRLAAYTGLIRRGTLEHNVRWLIKTLLEKN